LDRENGAKDRIQKREDRARIDLERLVSDDPATWNALATLRPSCTTGRISRLRAAEAYYRAQDLESCLHQLNLLILREPESDEALVARLRKVEVLREQGQRYKALNEIESLKSQHGDRVISRTLGEETITTTLGERLDALKSQIQTIEAEHKPVPGLPLELAWSGRLELDQLRSTTVYPLSSFSELEDDSRYLVLTLTGARLMDSRNGQSLWRFDLEHAPASIAGGIFLERNRQALELLHLDSRVITLWNKKYLIQLDLASGGLLWRKSAPVPPAVDPAMNGWLHCASDGASIIGVTEARQMIHIEPETGEILWAIADTGLLVGTPEIKGDRILSGYSIPDKVEVRDLESGLIIGSWELEGNVAGLSSTPRFTADGWIYGTEGGLIRKHAEDGMIQWEQQLPSELSNLHLNADSAQIIAQLYWTESEPTLLGVSVESGELLWQKKLPQSSRRVISVKPMGSELLLVCDGFTDRNLICLNIPGNPICR